MVWPFLLKGVNSPAPAQITSQGNIGRSVLKAVSKNGSLYMEMTLGASLKDYEHEDFTAGTSITVIPSYQISSKTMLGLLITAKQGFTGPRKTALSTTYLSASQKIARLGKNDFISVSTTGRAYLPLNREQKADTSFRGRIYIRPMIVLDLTKIGIPYLKYTFRPSYSENLHQYETFNGVVNNQRALGVISALEVQLTEKLVWGTLFGINEQWNYQGTRSETYVIDSSVEWNLLAKGGLSAGYSIESATQTATGKNKIKLYDNGNGHAYLTLAYSF